MRGCHGQVKGSGASAAYCGAGACKLCHSVQSMRAGRVPWWSGSMLQAFIFEATFLSNKDIHSSCNVPTPFSYVLQHLHVLCP